MCCTVHEAQTSKTLVTNVVGSGGVLEGVLEGVWRGSSCQTMVITCLACGQGALSLHVLHLLMVLPPGVVPSGVGLDGRGTSW